jgi:hypothetical protein
VSETKIELVKITIQHWLLMANKQLNRSFSAVSAILHIF